MSKCKTIMNMSMGDVPKKYQKLLHQTFAYAFNRGLEYAMDHSHHEALIMLSDSKAHLDLLLSC